MAISHETEFVWKVLGTQSRAGTLEAAISDVARRTGASSVDIQASLVPIQLLPLPSGAIGGPMIPQNHCRQCAHPLEAGSLYCSRCGTPVGSLSTNEGT